MNDSAELRRRYWRLVRIMAGLAVVGVAVVLGYLYATGANLRLHFIIALALGIMGSVLLAGLLMGLVFLSNRSGHDEAVRDEDWRER